MRRFAEKEYDDGRKRGTGPRRPGDSQRGFVLVIVLILIAALALLGLAASRNMLTDIGIAENQGETRGSSTRPKRAPNTPITNCHRPLRQQGRYL